MRSLCALLVIFGIGIPPAVAERLPVDIDGQFDDWVGAILLYSDPTGDAGASGIDLRDAWGADDLQRLFLRFEVGRELQLNSGHDLVLYLDTDLNSQTGLAIGEIGAELEWHFGSRSGTYRYGAGSTSIEQAAIGLIGMPTVTAEQFEVALRRDARPDGAHPLFPGDAIRILLWDRPSGDRLPQTGQTIIYSFDEGSLPPEENVAFGRFEAGDLRIITQNVHNDSPWNASLAPGFRRVYRSVVPEILNLQEIYSHTPQETADLIESWLPSDQGETWYFSGTDDCHTISRYPIESTWSLDGNHAALINTTAALGKRLLMISAHLPCCTNDAGRQQEVDHILSFIRDAKSPGGSVTLDEGTPIVIVGDMNFVGLRQQLISLTTGDVVNEGQYGSDFDPDWDGSALTDLVSRQTERRLSYTWRNDSSDFWPGRLDFVIYSDAVLEARNHFIIEPSEMSADSLTAHGLLPGDSSVSDHRVTCVDFRPAAPSESTDTADLTGIRFAAGPNPSRGSTTIRLLLDRPAAVHVDLLDISGRLVARPFEPADLSAGRWSRDWASAPGRDLSAGVYFLRLTADDGRRKIVRTTRWSVVR